MVIPDSISKKEANPNYKKRRSTHLVRFCSKQVLFASWFSKLWHELTVLTLKSCLFIGSSI